jgi:hypothetical protein
VLALAGVAVALGSLAALFISETGKLAGCSEDDYDAPIVIAIAVEALATLLLTPLVATSFRRAVARPAQPAQRPRRPAGYAASRSA